MKITITILYASCAVLAGFVPVCFGAENMASSSTSIVVGDPAQGADLPAAILNAYAKGARNITITPGIYTNSSAREMRFASGGLEGCDHPRQESNHCFRRACAAGPFA